MRTTLTRFSLAALPAVILGLILMPAAQGQAQGTWTVAMRAMQNPLPIGQCTAIEVVVRDASGVAPLRPNGRQLDWQDFELSFTSPAPDAFAWSNEKHRFLCARAPTAASAIVVAYYPGSHLQPNEILPGMSVQQQVEVFMQGVPAAPVASAAAPYQPAPGYQAAPAAGQAGGSAAGYPQGGAAAGGSAGAAAAGYPQGGAAAGGPAGAAAAGYPQGGAAAGAAAASYPQAGAAAGGQAGAAAAGYPPSGAAAAAGGNSAYAPQAGGAASAAGAPTVPPAPTQVAAAPAKGVGGFFKKIGEHVKKTAGAVATQTTENLASSATQIVDATAQTGSGLVAGATAQVSSAARSTVGGVGKAIIPLKGSSDNLAVSLNYGQAEFRNKLFSGTTAVLEPAGRDLVERLAADLKARPGRFMIQVHLDPIENALQLSEQRAAVLKEALVNRGVEKSRLESLGYGASAPKPEAPPDGGPPSSTRVVISLIQAQ